jgi:hypothetical protein
MPANSTTKDWTPRKHYNPLLGRHTNGGMKRRLLAGYIWITAAVRADIARLIAITSEHEVGCMLRYERNKTASARKLVDGTRKQILKHRYYIVRAELSNRGVPCAEMDGTATKTTNKTKNYADISVWS